MWLKLSVTVLCLSICGAATQPSTTPPTTRASTTMPGQTEFPTGSTPTTNAQITKKETTLRSTPTTKSPSTTSSDSAATTSTASTTSTTTDAPQPTSAGYTLFRCDFENGIATCGLGDIEDELELVDARGQGSPGPVRSGANGTHYLYASGDAPTINIALPSNSGSMCIRFWYYLFTTEAEIQLVGLAFPIDGVENIWSASYSDSPNQWKENRQLITRYNYFGIDVRQGVAIDDIMVTRGSCEGGDQGNAPPRSSVADQTTTTPTRDQTTTTASSRDQTTTTASTRDQTTTTASSRDGTTTTTQTPDGLEVDSASIHDSVSLCTGLFITLAILTSRIFM